MSKRSTWRLLAAIAVGGGLAFSVPALPAVGQASPPGPVVSVGVGDPATLVAKGAAVSVPVDVTCPAGSTGYLSVRVTERAGSRIASGFGSSSVVCTGAPQTVDVLVTGQGQAFKKGPAVAEASLSVCSYFYFCQFASDTGTIQIAR